MNDAISHIGTVDCIERGMVRVRITQSSACIGCKVASYCNSTESKEKIIDVRGIDVAAYTEGQQVTVMAASSVGMKAVLIAFVVPVILMLATISVVLWAGGSELAAALSGFGILIPYYIVLYLLRDRLERTLTFYLES